MKLLMLKQLELNLYLVLGAVLEIVVADTGWTEFDMQSFLALSSQLVLIQKYGCFVYLKDN